LILPFAYIAAKGAPWTLPNLPPSHLSFTEGQSAPQLISWFFIALWTFVDPSFHQRVCAAKDAQTARRGILISMAFWFLSDAMTTAAGLYARGLIPDLSNPLQAYPALADRLLPPVFKGLFLAGVASSTLAALSSSGFLAAISLGRDAAGKAWNVDEKRQETWIRWGLVAAGLLSVFLALALPSVVDLWFTVGSTVIPGLLIPLLSAYFEPLRLTPKAAFLCSLGGWLGASTAWAAGISAPFYAGLAASLTVWFLGKALARS
jgi:solute:Na+ symporter, SSS family